MAKEATSEPGKIISLPTGAVRFGPYRFDPTNVTLSRGEAQIHLPPRALGLLEYLVRRPGLLVSKEELLEAIWVDIHVTEDALTQAISLIRQALGDDPREPSYIETVPRLGYRFVAEVSAAPRAQAGAAGSQTGAAGQSQPLTPRPLAPETELGRYKILTQIGAGAMGEVWRARDNELSREVAIKVVPSELADEAKVMRRFRREARLLAQVNHRNIATIHGVEETDGLRFIVMELLEGETLEERLRGGPFPVEEALEIGRQVAEALEAAHDKGIIHRDLKPANVILTDGQRVKVLDFGLAKELPPDGREETGEETSATKSGVMPGTAPYMSPEQVRGQAVDRRTDIWAFGCLLFELLTGQGAFRRDTVADTLAAILDKEPDWNQLPDGTPDEARRLLTHCLAKDPRDRLHDIADARIEIAEALEAPAGIVAPPIAGDPVRPPAWRRALPWALVAASLLITAGTVLWSMQRSPASSGAAAPRHMSVTLEMPGVELLLEVGTDSVVPLAISPDGASIVSLVRVKSGRQLFLRQLDEMEGQLIEGTEGAQNPFFSLDGAWIGYMAGFRLWKVPVSGGAPIPISDSQILYGATWAPDDTIIHTPMIGGGLQRVSASGGSPEPLTRLNTAAGEESHDQASMLPDGRSVLFTIWKGGSYADADIAVLSLDTLNYHVVQEGGSCAVYAPTGHLVYAHRDQLLAVPFDLETLRTTGTPFRLAEGVFTVGGIEFPIFSLSAAGTLAYVRHEAWTKPARLVWLDREHNVTAVEGSPLPPDPQIFDISRDGLDLTFMTEGPFDIYTYDLAEGLPDRVTLHPGWDGAPVWADEGERIVFSSARSGTFNLWWKSADGMGEAEELLPSDPGAGPRYPESWSPRGVLAYREKHEANSWDIWLLPMEGDRDPQPFATTPSAEWGAQFSPDGGLLAYSSNERGVLEVYIEPVPQTGEKVRVSRNAGRTPLWSADGKQLYFFEPGDSRWVLVADIETEPRLDSGTPVPFFEYPENVERIWPFETSQGFLGIEREPTPRIRQVEVVLNFFELLERRKREENR